MKKLIYNKYDKRLMAELPVETFKGKIIVVLSALEAERAVDFLLKSSLLGLDTETRPSFKRGQQHNVALLQVATEDTCFLFRLRHTGFCPAIVRLLEDTTVSKVGLSWHDDLGRLLKLGHFKPGRFIDLQQHVGEIGVEDMSLQKLYANLMHKKISKRQQLTNWDADVLGEKQKLYAATDAWACVVLYKELMRLEQTGAYKLIIQEEEHENDTTEKG